MVKKSVNGIAGLGFIGSKMLDEILQHRQVLDRQVFELDPAAPRTDLFPGALRHFMVIYNSAIDLVHVDETMVAAEYFYMGAPVIILLCGQIPEAQPPHADILDLPHIYDLIGFYESSECPFFSLEPLEFSFFFRHFFRTQPREEGNPTI
jgi:hypothetical protein